MRRNPLPLPGMKEAGYGRIINIISTSVRIPHKNLGVSNTIRGAVASWAKTLSNELGEFNITVNNILPGYTTTARLKTVIEKNAEKSKQVRKGYCSQILTYHYPSLRIPKILLYHR